MHLHALLDHLTAVLTPARQRAISTLHREALLGHPVPRLPLVLQYPLPPDARFRPFPHREVFTDPAKMLFNELTHAFDTSIACRDRLDDDLPATVRANFGTVLVASLFGAPVEQFGDNPPWVVHRPDRPLPLEAVIACDPLDFTRGWIPRLVETCEFYQTTLRAYPLLAHNIRIVLPDLQSPFDNLELIVGSNLFIELRDRPALVSRALQAVARAQVGLARRLAPFITDGPDGFAHQHATLIRGRILLRDDSVLLMSPALYRELVAPHDEFVLRELGGGGIHACGCLQRHAPMFLANPSVQCLDFGQSELNDVDAVFRLARPGRWRSSASRPPPPNWPRAGFCAVSPPACRWCTAPARLPTRSASGNNISAPPSAARRRRRRGHDPAGRWRRACREAGAGYSNPRSVNSSSSSPR